MHTGRRVWRGAVLALLLVGCGRNTLDKPEARIAYAAYRVRFGDAASPRLLRNSDHACAESGTFHLHEARVKAPNLLMRGTLEACSSQGVIMDGEIRAEHRAKGPSVLHTPNHATLTEKGDLTFRGRVAGTCEVDLETDHTPATHTVLARRGVFCGYPVAELAP